MSSFGKRMAMATFIFSSGLVVSHLVWSQGATSGLHGDAKERARIVFSQPLSKLDGDHLKVVLVEVNYGPGEASSPHSHPCAVIGYVVEGTLRTEVKASRR
jgi:quercetin dioxygenase-like cupin family protein